MKAKKRVVIADDSITVQKLVNLTLAGLNFEVITSMDGHDALLKIKRLKPDLVLADTELQEIRGADLCEEVRSSSELLDTRLILMHSTQAGGSASDFEGAPFDFFLEKPFDSKTLIAVVQKVLNEEPSTHVRDPKEAEEEAKEQFESSSVPGAVPFSEPEEETVTQKSEGLFSSYRKAEGVSDVNSRLAAIAEEVSPGGFEDKADGEDSVGDGDGSSSEESSPPEQTIDERLASVDQESSEETEEVTEVPSNEKASLVTEEDEQVSAGQLFDALDEVSKVAEPNDLASHDSHSPDVEKIAREEIRQWIDQNLRSMVEEHLKEELAKITEDADS